MAIGPYGALLDAVRGVRWPARRAVPGGAPGAHQARRRGIAPEFAEYRPYRQGDDPRRVDWRLLARSDRAYIRLAPNRAVLGTTLVVDASASMAFPARDPNKWSLARELAMALAAVAHAGADRGARRRALRRRDGTAPANASWRHRRDGTHARWHFAGGGRSAGARARGRTRARGDRHRLSGRPRRRAARGRALAAQGGGGHGGAHRVPPEVDPLGEAVLVVDPEAPLVERSLTANGRAGYTERFASWRARVAREWLDDGVAYVEARDDEAAERVVRRVVAASQRAVHA